MAKTDARGVVTEYTYDALNRLTTETYPANPALNTSYTYDDTSNDNKGVGRLTGIQGSSGSTAYSYDSFGNRLTDVRVIDGITYTTAYSYDAANRLTAITYPTGLTVSYTRNSGGQIVQVDADGQAGLRTFAHDIQYLPFGGFTQLEYGNGLLLSRSYDQDYRLIDQQLGSLQSLAYTHNPVDNISAIDNLFDPRKSQTFDYDPLHRLTLEMGEYGSKSYQYDAVGNREQRLWDRVDGTTSTMNLNYALDSNRLTQRYNVPINYTAAGNMTNKNAAVTLDYDERHRIISASKNGILKGTYTYNALGQRVQKTIYVGTQATPWIFHYGPDGQLLAATEINAFGDTLHHNFIWLGNTPVGRWLIKVDAAGNLQWDQPLYLHPDHLNASRAATDDTQVIRWRWDSDGFGEGRHDTDPDGDGKHVRIYLRQSGQYYDWETSLHYNYFRTYDPVTGRYLESDPIGLNGGINTYTYALNNPLFWIDPYELDITVSFNPNAARGFGHVGIGVNTPNTVGQRPQLGASSVQMGLGLNVPGGISSDPAAPSSITIPSTPEQDRNAQQCIDTRTQQQQDYNLYNNNCAQFVQQCLGAAGINTPNTILPETLFNNLRQNFGGNP